jgi:hypothetical protein
MFVVNTREGIKNRRSKRDIRRFMKDTGRSDKGDRGDVGWEIKED